MGVDNNSKYSLTGNSYAYKVDIKPTAQHRLSSSIVESSGSAVDKIKAVETVWYKFNELGGQMGFPLDSTEMGLIAQDLMAVEPALVRPMWWLGSDAAGPGESFYFIDYACLNVLVLDAMNELNARAEAAKIQLGMTPDTLATRATSTTLPPAASNFQLSVTNTTTDGVNRSVWTLTADNAVDGLVCGFKISGNCNLANFTSNERVRIYYMSDELLLSDETIAEGFNPTLEGRCFGTFVFDEDENGNVSAEAVLDYTIDTELTGAQNITMTMKEGDSKNGPGPQGTITATVNL